MSYQDKLVHLSQLLAEEKKHELELYLNSFKNKTIHERKLEGKCLFPISVDATSYGMAGTLEVEISLDKEMDLSRFNSGSVVSLFFSEDNIKSRSFCTANIKAVKNEKITLVLNAEETPDELDQARIGIDLTADERTYKVMEHTLNYFINTEKPEEKQLLKKLWGDLPLAPIKGSVENQFSGLNEWQVSSLNKAVFTEDFMAIHGPPGTGKTTTLVQCIKESIKLHEEPILVSATSNAAVDHLVKCMIREGIKVVRIGNLSRIDEEVQLSQIDVQIQNDRDYKFVKDLKKRALDARKKAEKYKRSFNAEDRQNRKKWYTESRALIKEAKQAEKYLIRKTLESAEVIATTLIGSDSEILRDFRFPVTFIDEAAQSLIPAALTPLKRSDKLVLAGDPFQLPALVKNENVAKKGLQVSLLELVMDETENRTEKLKTQYRMDQKIMAFSNTKFYENELLAHESVSSHGLTSDGYSPVEFIDTAGCDFSEGFSKSGSSLTNPEECTLIQKRLQELEPYKRDLTIGVISPYRGQVNYLKEHLEGMDVTINTIDAFQGQERDVIIVSLVRSNEEGIIGFLKDYRRMNVAMTRARKKLILIGDSSTIGADEFYNDFLEYVEKEGSYRTAWEYASY